MTDGKEGAGLVDVSLTSSGLLARHTANIAELSQKYGIQLGNENDTSQSPGGPESSGKGSRIEVVMAQNNSSLEGIFDQNQFEKRLHSVATDVSNKKETLDESPIPIKKDAGLSIDKIQKESPEPGS